MMEDDLIIKYLADEATAAERSEVDAWLSESEQHQKRLASFRTVWELAGKCMPAAIPDSSEALEQLKKGLGAKSNGLYEIPVKRPLRISAAKWQAAAVIACILAGATAWVLSNQHNEPANTTSMVKTDPTPEVREDFAGNTLRTDSLPDGTVVTLNPLAKIRYAKGLAGIKRTVQLQGDAFFAVAHDTARPFVVLINEMLITVVGTSFSVCNHRDTTEVTVATGTVWISRAEDSIILHAGDRLVAPAYGKLLRKEINNPGTINDAKNNGNRQPVKRQKDSTRQDPSVEESMALVRRIINDLVAEKIVVSRDSLSWFGLDSSQFVVDGHKQPAALYKKFKGKYLRPGGPGYFYGPVKVYGRGIFFEKKDLYK